MKIGEIMGALADVITMTERVDRLDDTVSEMAALFRDDSKARDEKFLEHDRRIQKLENFIEFAERFGGQGRLEPPACRDKDARLEELLREGLESGEGVEVTPEYFAERRRALKARLSRRDDGG